MSSGSSNRTAEIQIEHQFLIRFSPNFFYIDTFILSNFSMPRQAYNTISRLDKERLREVYRNGGDFLNLATQLNINRTTAYNIVRREVVEKKRGGKSYKKVDSSMLDFIVEILEEKTLVTVSNLNKELLKWMMSAEVVNSLKIYIDKFGCNIRTKRNFGRSRKGQRSF